MVTNRLTHFWRSYLITSAIALAVLPMASNAFIDYHGQRVDITATTTVTTAGTPAVAIVATNDNALSVNAFELELTFDPEQLQLSSSTIASPLCEERFVISDTIDNASGTALVQCGTITPFTGTTTTLAVFEINRDATSSSLTFGPRTSVLAHDGYGTNVTGSTIVVW